MHLITLTLFIALSVLQLAHAQSLNSTRVITADSKDIDTIGDLITEECLQEVSVFEVGILIFTAFSQFFPCWRHSLSPFLFRTTRPVLHLPSVAKRSVRSGTNFEHTTASIVGRFWAGTDGVFGWFFNNKNLISSFQRHPLRPLIPNHCFHCWADRADLSHFRRSLRLLFMAQQRNSSGLPCNLEKNTLLQRKRVAQNSTGLRPTYCF